MLRSRPLQRLPLHLELLEDRCVPNAAGWEPPDLVRIQITPDDPQFTSGSLYGLDTIEAPLAWNTTTGSFAVTVGVIDTGIDYTHQDLYRNIWINQEEIPTTVRSQLTDVDGDDLITFFDLNDSRNQGSGKITDLNDNGFIDGGDILRRTSAGGWADGVDQDPFNVDGESYAYVDDLVGWDWVNNDNDPFDDHRHGTHVAGTIGAIGDNGVGVTGVNWNVQLAALKFLDETGAGSTNDAARALDYTTGNDISISNNSWGGSGFSSAMYRALLQASLEGHIFVAAAGNAGDDNNADPHYPSSYNLSNIISVAASDANDGLANFSNYGRTAVHLAAPGVRISSTTPGNTYGSLSGTSMATPHVTGVVALLQAQNPNWSFSQIINKVLDSAERVSSLENLVATRGRLNAANALGSLATAPSAPATPTDTVGPKIISAVPNVSSTNTVKSVRVTFSEAIRVDTFTPNDVQYFRGPNGTIRIDRVTQVGSSRKVFDIGFREQAAVGDYSFIIGPNLTDDAGNAMNQDSDAHNGEGSADRLTVRWTIQGRTTSTSTLTNGTDVTIRDREWAVSNIYVSKDVAITDINVRVDVDHTYDGDLYMYLRGPDGETVLLVRRRGRSGNGFAQTLFDDDASTMIFEGTAPFSGAFRPEERLSSFNNKSSRGTWQLLIYDAAMHDTGVLRSWSLTIQGETTSSSNAMDVGKATNETTVAGDANLLSGLDSALRSESIVPSPQQTAESAQIQETEGDSSAGTSSDAVPTSRTTRTRSRGNRTILGFYDEPVQGWLGGLGTGFE